jgi:hypothetical protein
MLVDRSSPTHADTCVRSGDLHAYSDTSSTRVIEVGFGYFQLNDRRGSQYAELASKQRTDITTNQVNPSAAACVRQTCSFVHPFNLCTRRIFVSRCLEPVTVRHTTVHAWAPLLSVTVQSTRLMTLSFSMIC